MRYSTPNYKNTDTHTHTKKTKKKNNYWTWLVFHSSIQIQSAFISLWMIPVLRDTFEANYDLRAASQIRNLYPSLHVDSWSVILLLSSDATVPPWVSRAFLTAYFSPVTYLGGFLKRSQRKHFHFCSHLMLSNGARWRDSWLEVWGGIHRKWRWRHMGRWLVEVFDWTVEMYVGAS